MCWLMISRQRPYSLFGIPWIADRLPKINPVFEIRLGRRNGFIE
jgi:hypothetical protein